MTTYEVIETEGMPTMIKRTDPDGREWWFPFAEDNSDYQRYLRWLENPDAEEGGTL